MISKSYKIFRKNKIDCLFSFYSFLTKKTVITLKHAATIDFETFVMVFDRLIPKENLFNDHQIINVIKIDFKQKKAG